MSTNKTQNYNLHSWLPADDFLRTEINENFTKLDTALSTGLAALTNRMDKRILFGWYSGSGSSERTISLGVTPRAVLLATEEGFISSNLCFGGLALTGKSVLRSSTPCLTIVEGGFQVSKNSISSTNNSLHEFYYIAFV